MTQRLGLALQRWRKAQDFSPPPRSRQALVGLGFESSRIDMRGFAAFNLYEAIGVQNPPFDLVVGVGLCSGSRRRHGFAPRGRFDHELTKKLARFAMLWWTNDLSFFSDRVDPASLAYSPVYRWSFTALRLK